MREDLTSLLNIISGINEKYEEIFRITGEKFNIFNALKLTHKEWAHSRILAELLSPDGSHGKDNLFLEKFLKIVAKKHITYAKTDEDRGEVGEKFSIESSIVQEEMSIDNSRFDIIITNQNMKIILENKIWSPEGNEQLEKYSKQKPTHLIFLTPDGKKAEKIGEGEFEYIKMSYKKDIQDWLEMCKKESVDNPILRETLTQYILLIRQLTGQTRRNEMEEEVIAIMKDSKYISAAFDIAGSFDAMKKRIMEDFFSSLKAEAEAPELGLEMREGKTLIELRNSRIHYAAISFYKREWEGKQLGITFHFVNGGNKIQYSIMSWDVCESLDDRIINEFSQWQQSKKYEKDKHCPIWKYLEEYDSYKDFCIAMVKDSKAVIKVFVAKIRELLEIMDDLELKKLL